MSYFSISILIGVAAGVLALYWLNKNKPGHFHDWRDYATTAFAMVLFSISTQMTSYVIIDAIPYINKHGFSKFLSRDIATGTLSLRVVTIIVSIKTGLMLYNSVANADIFLFRKEEFHYDEVNALQQRVGDFPLYMINLTQHGIYLFASMILWHTKTVSATHLYFAVMSWSLLFIIDDWTIIHQTIVALKGRILKSHFKKIFGFNLIFVLGSILVTYRNFDAINLFATLMLLACFAFNIRYMREVL